MFIVIMSKYFDNKFLFRHQRKGYLKKKMNYKKPHEGFKVAVVYDRFFFL